MPDPKTGQGDNRSPDNNWGFNNHVLRDQRFAKDWADRNNKIVKLGNYIKEGAVLYFNSIEEEWQLRLGMVVEKGTTLIDLIDNIELKEEEW